MKATAIDTSIKSQRAVVGQYNHLKNGYQKARP
nr:MAG TPA: hypothetical protein [Caudoviricetes sp.]